MEELIKEDTNQEESVESVEEATRDQYLCDKWFGERKSRLTSSKFGLICKRKKAVDKKFCESLVNGRDLSKVPSVAYRLAHEAVELERFRSQMGLEVIRKAGFFTCTRYPYLGATRDGVIPAGNENENKPEKKNGECLVEIKCPYAHHFTGAAPDYLILREDGEYEI